MAASFLPQETFRKSPRVSYSTLYKMRIAVRKMYRGKKDENGSERDVCVHLSECLHRGVCERVSVMKAPRSMTCVSLPCNLKNTVHIIELVK